MAEIKLPFKCIQKASFTGIRAGGNEPFLITFVLTSLAIVLATVSAEFKFYKSNPNGRLQHVVFGNSLTINCTTNDPNAVTSLYHKLESENNWEKKQMEDSKNINKSGDVYTVVGFGVFDAGWYQCRATNANNIIITWIDPSTRVTPIGTHRPEAKISPVEKSLDVGENFNFTCSTRSINTIQWFKQPSIPISSDQVVTTTVNNIDIVILMIKNAKMSDTGSYTCIATYDRNTDSKIATLLIFEPKIPTIVNYSGKNASVVVRSMENSPTQIQLYCISKGYPLPKVMWYRNNKEIKVPGCVVTTKTCKNSKYMLFMNVSMLNHVQAILTIFKINYEDHGTYVCKAVNRKGDISVTIPVNVETGPVIWVAQRGQEILTMLGKTVNISCNASGNPVPDVFWTRVINDPKVLKHGKGTAILTLKKVSKNDLGNYTCNANNFRSVTKVFIVREIKSTPTPEAVVQGTKSEDMIIIIVCVCFAFLVVVLICFILYRRQKINTNKYLLGTGIADYQIDPDRSLLEQCRHLPYDLDWEFPEERLILGETLGTGAFGLVLKAEAIGMPAFKPRDESLEAKQLRERLRRESVTKKKKKELCNSITLAKLTVAVKSLKDGASRNDYTDLASELKILIHLRQHKNIVNILGACTRGRRLMVIIEFAPHGDLLSFLRERRDIYDPNWVKTLNNPDQEFTLVDLAMAAYQISQGMEFLASRKCVHRDLAARNILVGQDYVIKISDFGLARDIYQDDLYVKTSTGLLPIKWMAFESLYDRVYTHMSDAWSFGIVLWEMFTLGGTPYPTVPVEQLFEFLAQGHRMRQPDYCPLEIYAMMSQCWHQCPEERPNFAEISERIEQVFAENVAEDTLGYLLLDNETEPSTNHYVDPNDCGFQSVQATHWNNDTISTATCEGSSQELIVALPPLRLNNNQYVSGTGNPGKTIEHEPLINQKRCTVVSQHESSV